MKFFVNIGLVAATGLLLAGCNDPNSILPKYMDKTVSVQTIGDCTQPTSDAWNGREPGECRVVFNDGMRMTVARPVMVGDVFRLTKEVNAGDNGWFINSTRRDE